MLTCRCVTLIVLMIAALGAACGSPARDSGFAQVGQPGADEQTCSRDQDCVLVEDCCGCFSGGSRTAVRADAVEGLSAAAESACAGRTCAEGIESNHRSCQASAAACRGGRCIPSL